MKKQHKVLVAAWVFVLPALIMGKTGWMGGSFLHLVCAVVGGGLAVWALVLSLAAFGDWRVDE